MSSKKQRSDTEKPRDPFKEAREVHKADQKRLEKSKQPDGKFVDEARKYIEQQKRDKA